MQPTPTFEASLKGYHDWWYWRLLRDQKEQGWMRHPSRSCQKSSKSPHLGMNHDWIDVDVDNLLHPGPFESIVQPLSLQTSLKWKGWRLGKSFLDHMLALGGVHQATLSASGTTPTQRGINLHPDPNMYSLPGSLGQPRGAGIQNGNDQTNSYKNPILRFSRLKLLPYNTQDSASVTTIGPAWRLEFNILWKYTVQNQYVRENIGNIRNQVLTYLMFLSLKSLSLTFRVYFIMASTSLPYLNYYMRTSVSGQHIERVRYFS